MEEATWQPEDVDITKPSIPRVYDYFLGGWHNFEADREAAKKVLALSPPDAVQVPRANRAFLRRAVRLCLDAGITQFLDLGSGVASVGNVHESAQQINPEARVVYVDVDPVAFVHCRNVLKGNPRAGAVHADLRDTERVLNAPVTNNVLDFDQPVALLMAAVLQFVSASDDPAGIIQRYAERLVPGSFLVQTHFVDEESRWRGGWDAYQQLVADWTWRSRAEVEALFNGFELIDPGVAFVEDWPHEYDPTFISDPPPMVLCAGIGRKPLPAPQRTGRSTTP